MTNNTNNSVEERYKLSRSFKSKKKCFAFIDLYEITDYEIINTSYKREYQGRIATTVQHTVYYN